MPLPLLVSRCLATTPTTCCVTPWSCAESDLPARTVRVENRRSSFLLSMMYPYLWWPALLVIKVPLSFLSLNIPQSTQQPQLRSSSHLRKKVLNLLQLNLASQREFKNRMLKARGLLRRRTKMMFQVNHLLQNSKPSRMKMARSCTKLKLLDIHVSKLHVRQHFANFVMISRRASMATTNFADTSNDITLKFDVSGSAVTLPTPVASWSTAKLVVPVRHTAPTTMPLLTYDVLTSTPVKTSVAAVARNLRVVVVWEAVAGHPWTSWRTGCSKPSRWTWTVETLFKALHQTPTWSRIQLSSSPSSSKLMLNLMPIMTSPSTPVPSKNHFTATLRVPIRWHTRHRQINNSQPHHKPSCSNRCLSPCRAALILMPSLCLSECIRSITICNVRLLSSPSHIEPPRNVEAKYGPWQLGLSRPHDTHDLTASRCLSPTDIKSDMNPHFSEV